MESSAAERETAQHSLAVQVATGSDPLRCRCRAQMSFAITDSRVHTPIIMVILPASALSWAAKQQNVPRI
jgi:hypothetical protein